MLYHLASTTRVRDVVCSATLRACLLWCYATTREDDTSDMFLLESLLCSSCLVHARSLACTVRESVFLRAICKYIAHSVYEVLARSDWCICGGRAHHCGVFGPVFSGGDAAASELQSAAAARRHARSGSCDAGVSVACSHDGAKTQHLNCRVQKDPISK